MVTEIVIDTLTGLTATVNIQAIAAGQDFILITDATGGAATLSTSGVDYTIVSGGPSTTPTCLNDGFAYSCFR